MTSECALTPRPIFGRDLCLKCVPEVATATTQLTARWLVETQKGLVIIH